MAHIEPFTIDIPDEVLARIRDRVRAYRWHEMPAGGGWDHGTDMAYMRELCAYWLDEYDWRAAEAALNRHAHFRAGVEDQTIHFIHEKGSGPAPMPLMISHGWPGSVLEFDAIIERLAHPERFGGRAEDAFDVVAPSLPGFGFSGKPARPIGPRRIAALYARLMTDVLGYESYIAQGGDWGAAVSSWLGMEHAPACRGIHLNVMIMRDPAGPQTAEEEAWARRFAAEQEMEEGYRTQQATRPQTLSYAMMDSPVGVAAWIVEKFRAWSDTRTADFDTVFTKDRLLTNIMIYLVTGTFNTASWIYYGRREEGGRFMTPEPRRVETPTGCAIFPAEFLSWPPRSYVERVYNVTHWSELDRGGHFAAMEAPDLLVDDIRAFARGLRGGQDPGPEVRRCTGS